MTRVKLLAIMLILAISINSKAQISAAERAVKRAEQKVADKIVEKTFNGLVDKLFGSDSTATTQDRSVKTDSTVTANSSPFGGLFSAKTVDKEYTFDLALHMEIQTKDKRGKGDPIDMISHYSSDSAYIGTEMQDVFNILDFSEMKSYSIIGGKVTIVNLQSFIDRANKNAKKTKSDEEAAASFTYEKSGRTETIAGYKCDEYLLKSEDSEGEVWVTEGIGINPQAYAKTFAANPSLTYPTQEQGVILKMNIRDLKEKSTMTMITKKVIQETVSYDLSKYRATDLSKIKF